MVHQSQKVSYLLYSLANLTRASNSLGTVLQRTQQQA